VINDACGPGHQCFDCAEFRAPIDHVEVESGVESPPHLLEDCEKRIRGPWRARHPSGKRGVEVMMRQTNPGVVAPISVRLFFLGRFHWQGVSPHTVGCVKCRRNRSCRGDEADLTNTLDSVRSVWLRDKMECLRQLIDKVANIHSLYVQLYQ